LCRARSREKRPARRGGKDTVWRTSDELRLNVRFELSKAFGDGRLRYAETAGRGANAAALDYRDEIPDLL
jgi:hypothetical protein